MTLALIMLLHFSIERSTSKLARHEVVRILEEYVWHYPVRAAMLILRWGAERVRSLIGCCGWAGAQAQYFSQFSVIEIQSTFYDPPAAKVAARWRALAPPDFEFCLKAWQLITHPCSSPTYRRLRGFLSPGRRQLCGFFQDTEEVWDAWKRTLEIAETVRASVILFQCPASFKATPGNIENLSRFFQKIGPQSFRLAWEPRGPWPCEVVRDLCAEHTLIHCVDPFTDRSQYGGVVYWRLHGKGSYSYRYSDEDLAQLKRLLYQTQAQDPAYLLFNNVSMKSDAERLMGLLTCRR
jgi:uncharacterized protein YecE (DUF72 family)